MTLILAVSVEKFIFSLEKETIAKVLRTIDLLEFFGPKLGLPHSRRMTGRIYELRVRGRQEARILYAFSGPKIILLHGFVKQSAKTPRKEIELAEKRLKALTIT